VDDVVEAIRLALSVGPERRAAARRHVIDHFDRERRRRSLHAIVDSLRDVT
jgi:hypothetical protein